MKVELACDDVGWLRKKGRATYAEGVRGDWVRGCKDHSDTSEKKERRKERLACLCFLLCNRGFVPLSDYVLILVVLDSASSCSFLFSHYCCCYLSIRPKKPTHTSTSCVNETMYEIKLLPLKGK